MPADGMRPLAAGPRTWHPEGCVWRWPGSHASALAQQMVIHRGARRGRGRGAHTKRTTHATERAPPRERPDSESEDEAHSKAGSDSTSDSESHSGSESGTSEDSVVEKLDVASLSVADKKVVPQPRPGAAQGKPPGASAELSRREREALEKERARQHYLDMKAKEDAARLAVIRKRREEEAALRAAEVAAREEERLARRRPAGY